MPNPLTLKLEQFVAFSDDERARLDDLLTYPAHLYARGEDIIREGDKVDQIHLVVSGVAARYKDTLSGGRQILAFLIPGDLCDVEVFVLEAMDHSIRAMTETRCVLIPAKEIKQMLTEVSSITQGLWWSTMTDSAVLRERIIDHGSRGARERIAHLFYEMLIRFRVVDGADDNSFPLAVTQDELADATGMTSVHVNRTMQQLRKDGSWS